MDSHASTTAFITSDMGVKEMHTIESTHTRLPWKVPSFYAQLLDLEGSSIVHLTAEKLAEEYEKQARTLEQIQAQPQPEPQPQSSGRTLRRQRRIMRQETWSMDDLKSELPCQQEDQIQIMRPIDPIQQDEQSPMKQPESMIPVLAGQPRGKGYFSQVWARLRPSRTSRRSADESAQHPSGRPEKPLRSRCSRRKGQGFIGDGAPPSYINAVDISHGTIDLSAFDPDMTLSNNHSASSLVRSSSDTAVDSQSRGRPGTLRRRQRSIGRAKSDPVLASCPSSTLSTSSIQTTSCCSHATKAKPSFATSRSLSSHRSSRQRTDSAYSQTASSSSSSSSPSRITSRAREAPQYKLPPRKLSIVVVGDGAVGKSAMTLRFLRDQFHDEYDPTIEDSYCKHITVDGQDYILDLTDTSGQFEYRSHWNDSFMRSADGFICVYSIASLGSFRELVGYRDQIWRAKESEHVPIMMVGNKCDLGDDSSERCVGTNAVARFAERSNALFVEASAKSGKNIDGVFIELVREIERQRRLQDGNGGGVTSGCYDREKETWGSIKGFATNVTPPVSASASRSSRSRGARRDVKNGHCGCTIM
ncbi:hypothetical protein BGZ75_007056 [Mortierella antarctica]|nr:hypothetical protein BGZ75_007056 [Mortierella antarctica]